MYGYTQLGGNGADPAERYYASLISTHWINKVYLDSTFIEDLLVLRSRRQYERWIRWQDTPTRIVMSPRGFCFVSAQFIWEWERFIEGWRILPPVDEDATVVGSNIHIHSRQEQQEGVELSPLRFDPFLPESTDLHIVSHETWDYLSQNYSMTGPKITKDDLMHSDIHKQWQYTIKRYADRVMLRF
ncbi:hypothetical protein BDB00DRAFT_828826 [Zychaea mexicana]|uniref:uncharacterized protein n=1 Tax=Zychaea mexicana TaxID=64656 RepID=UPI0022FEBCDC|nr:uncharacterized protein BDB00DRAFT_828826 [Zychaea mexicana]KAI9492394.1 hypothetical protein BDB00DRAFT_828826 [Zychaea mexicana]